MSAPDLPTRVLQVVGFAFLDGEPPRILGPWIDMETDAGDRVWVRCDLSGDAVVQAYRDGMEWAWRFDDDTDSGDGHRTLARAKAAADESAQESGWLLLSRADAEALMRAGRRK